MIKLLISIATFNPNYNEITGEYLLVRIVRYRI